MKYTVKFKSPINGEVFKTGVYENRKQIRRASDRFDNAYGGYLTLEINDENGQAISIYQIPREIA